MHKYQAYVEDKCEGLLMMNVDVLICIGIQKALLIVINSAR